MIKFICSGNGNPILRLSDFPMEERGGGQNLFDGKMLYDCPSLGKNRDK
ncbi:MAG: hypothetical protein HFE39_00065 [Clostridiales bacterium]|nr:hypothetical protein [Clostridiales bacterium]